MVEQPSRIKNTLKFWQYTTRFLNKKICNELFSPIVHQIKLKNKRQYKNKNNTNRLEAVLVTVNKFDLLKPMEILIFYIKYTRNYIGFKLRSVFNVFGKIEDHNLLRQQNVQEGFRTIERFLVKNLCVYQFKQTSII